VASGPKPSGKSGVCIGTSSAKCEKTTMAKTSAAVTRSFAPGIFFFMSAANTSAESADHRTDPTRLCEYGIVSSNGFIFVKPGTMRTLSTPASTNTAKRMSSSCAPTNSAPSDARGANLFAASETP